MIEVIYALVILVATFLGACAGLGGGVIIKPIFDALQAHDIITISFLATSVVFTMSAYSLGRQVVGKAKLDADLAIFVAMGSVLGGLAGEKVFRVFNDTFSPAGIVAVQSAVLVVLMVAVLCYVNGSYRSYCIENRFIYVLSGVLLGVLSTFLGIGGGPMNVALFTLIFSIPLRLAAVYSIITIFFSQGTKLLFISLTSGFSDFDLNLLWFALPAALCGSVLGTMANRRFSAAMIVRMFNIAVVATIILTSYNFIGAMFGM